MVALNVSSKWNSNKEPEIPECVREGEPLGSVIVRGDVDHEGVGGQEESGVAAGQILETLQQQILNLAGGSDFYLKKIWKFHIILMSPSEGPIYETFVL